MLAGNCEKLVTSPLFAQDSQKLIIYYIFEYINECTNDYNYRMNIIIPDRLNEQFV